MNAATRLLALTATVCPDPEAIHQGQRFHSNNLCDRAEYYRYKSSLRRDLRVAAARTSGTVAHIPNQKTSYCPLDPSQFTSDAEAPSKVTGFDTVWIAENTASTPVVISYMNEQGIEVSALNPKIAPPELDANAILQPGQWTSVEAFEGHVFQVKEILPDGSAGRVLLQHRTGLVPVGERFQGEIYDCPLEDIEPLTPEGVRVQDFAGTPEQTIRPCNVLDVGFRNVVGCPLHGYYVTPGKPDTGVQCEDKFEFHLGTETVGLPDPIKGWKSATKFQSTYIGHTFSFRLAHDPTVLVDSVTLQPTQIPDCPDLKQTVGVKIGGEAERVAAKHGETEDQEEDTCESSQAPPAAATAYFSATGDSAL